MTIDSDKLRHFPAADPPPALPRPERIELQAQIDQYLDSGGTITVITHTHITYPDPPRNRRQQIAWQKKRNRFKRD